MSSLALISCGGGGGGGGSSTTGGGLVFSADKSSVSFTYLQNQVPGPAPQVVTITATGQYSGTLYVGATVTGQGIAAPIVITVTGTSASAQISAATGLAAGTYSGQINLLACSDANCAHQVGNSPIVIGYTVTVQPGLQTSPSAVAVSAVSGASPTQVVGVQLPQGQATFSTAIESGSPWLSVSTATASSFTLAFSSLPSGTYTGSVQVITGSAVAVVGVTYTVSPPPGGDQQLAANPNNLTLATVEDATTTASLVITPPSWNPQVSATLEYPGGAASGWLSLTPTATGDQVLADATSLSAGSYTANIRLHGAYPSSDVLVPVALTIGVGLVRPADVPVSVGAETTAAALSGSVPVNVVAGPAVGWSAASNVPWLMLTTSSGQTGSSLSYTIDASQLGTLPDAALAAAQITITPTHASMTPVSFNVNVNKNLPQITSLAPYVQLTGQPARVVLRGSGFASIASLTARLAIAGGTLSNATLVNDTEVVAQFSALPAGAHIVSASNALGLTTATGTVVAVSAPVYAYAAVPISGAPRSLAYDPERGSLYGANFSSDQVMSFHYSGGTWTASSVPVPALYDLGLSLDGSSLLVGSGASPSGVVLQRLDPVTLASTGSSPQLPYAWLGFSYVGFGFPATNDARAWIEIGDLAFVTPGSLTPTIVTPTNVSTLFNGGGPWCAVSRDGERLLINQGGEISPTPPMLYMNAADSVVRTNPAGLTFSTQLSLSETGDRVLFDHLTLRDGAFNLIGNATLPSTAPGYIAMNGQVTPDGSRVYVLAYANDASTNSSEKPRVFVFDATTVQPDLAVLGYFELADYPGCAINVVNPSACPDAVVAGAIALDGRTLFFAGTQNLVVSPVPAVLSTLAVPPAGSSARRRVPATTVWPVSVH